MGPPCITLATFRNACLFFISIFVFAVLHTSITFYGIKGVDLNPYPCKNHRTVPFTSAKPTQPPTKKTLIPKNLYYSTGVRKDDLWLSAAILDTRSNQTRVHVSGTERKNVVKGEFFCRWRYKEEDAQDIIYMEVKAEHSLIDPHWPHWGPIFANRFVCNVPREASIDFISIISRDGNYKIDDIPVDEGVHVSPRQTLAVCVKPATSALSVIRLVEWFEQLRAAGVAHIIMYHTDVYGNGRYVLEYYARLGVLTLVPYPYLFAALERVDTDEARLSDQDRYAVYQQIYLAALQECLNRFRPAYETVLFMDIDEVLLPFRNEPLSSTIAKIRSVRTDVAGFLFLTSWHFEEFGAKKNDSAVDKLYMQKYPESTEPIDNQPKCVVNTDLAETVNFHGVMNTYRDKHNSNVVIPWQEFGYLHHFRGRCDGKFEKKRCDTELLPKHRPDRVLLRYRDEVVAGIDKVMETLQLH